MASSAEVRRTKTKLATAAVAHVYGMEFPAETPSRRAVISALTDLSERRLRALCVDVGLDKEGEAT